MPGPLSRTLTPAAGGVRLPLPNALNSVRRSLSLCHAAHPLKQWQHDDRERSARAESRTHNPAGRRPAGAYASLLSATCPDPEGPCAATVGRDRGKRHPDRARG
jgi:hypothetical protein